MVVGDEMDCIGIDIGSTSVKVVLLRDEVAQWQEAVFHEGEIPQTLHELLARRGGAAGIPALATGNAGRHQLRTAQAIPPLCIEAALRAVGEQARAVVSLGGESIVVYTLSPEGRVQNTLTGDKCAAGTGEFFRQQLRRMNLDLDVLDRIPDATPSHPLSSRCSVFMKSDCTHKLNKGEATKEEIAVSLADVLASKAVEFLTRARITTGRVVAIGGVTQNRFLLRYLREKLPAVELVVPPQAACFEAYGAALLAAAHGEPLPPPATLIDPGQVPSERYPALAAGLAQVTFLPSRRGTARAGGEYVLGIDGGSTTTKAVLVDTATLEIVAAHYGRTHGDPVEALRQVLGELAHQLQDAIGDAPIRIPLAATTGSSREVLGVFVETRGVFNEIIAHTLGTTHFRPDIDTLFEIGGQDAKYVLVKNGVPIDYAMNEACSAGTGSFLEESARGDLNIQTAPEIGPLALQSDSPLKFGEHCSAFINSDIRLAIQQGAAKSDIVAGIVFSIVANYLNRVVGNRSIGGQIVLQGGVAKNPAVPAAFAAVLGKEIVVPPDPELLGAYGVALLALKKSAQGLLDRGDYSLDLLRARQIRHGKTFRCQSCENDCPIRTLFVGEHRYFFGGRCNKYTNLRQAVAVREVQDFVALREQLLFADYAPDPATLRPRSPAVVGVPRAFTTHTLWPLYAWFFHDLGVKTVLATQSLPQGVQRVEAAYCFPGEIAHGMTADLVARGVDYFFFPQVKNMESLEREAPATLCPITQGLPYYLRPAFGIPDRQILRPVIDFQQGYEAGAGAFAALAEQLGFSREEGLTAFRTGLAQQQACWRRLREIGQQALAAAREQEEPVIALFGRPYNAFAAEANMGIPRKLTSRGYKVIPFDFFPVGDEPISPNMYWYYGQLDLKAAALVKEHPNLYLCYISNFGCAPDSFLLHFVRWLMGTKPYLVLELDSHTADAGIDTRLEAFLDIIEGYRQKRGELRDVHPRPRYRVDLQGAASAVVDTRNGERFPLTHPRVRLVWPSMGAYATEAIAVAAGLRGIRSEYLPVADARTTQLARNVASGKECIPTLLVLGQILELLLTRPPAPDEILAVIVPKTTGPCRTGQYGPFYEGTLARLGIDNVAIMNLSSDNGYQELGPDFTRLAWHAVVLGDHFKDLETSLKILAFDPPSALAVLAEVWRSLMDCLRTDISRLAAALEAGAARLARIPKRGTADELKKVLIVGEIYVRRDDFSVTEAVEHLAANGILAKVTTLAEWVHYCDYLRDEQLQRRLQQRPWWQRPWTREFGELLLLEATQGYMHLVEERFRRILLPTGLLPTAPHDMAEIMAGAEQFTSVEFETEATISTLVGVLALNQGYDGIIAIAPFACLPGRLIRAFLDPYCRERGLPFLALENDGLAYPPNVLSRLEIFMLNVLRHRARGTGPAEVDSGRPPAPVGRGWAAARLGRLPGVASTARLARTSLQPAAQLGRRVLPWWLPIAAAAVTRRGSAGNGHLPQLPIYGEGRDGYHPVCARRAPAGPPPPPLDIKKLLRREE
ncbi:MAG: acyl-CoA dehydratase activase [Myxococcota bacterium]|jgi:predicted CoA-substrate-specific enzyme activase|nr:acyl-CoA dehydratase activase [Myxococcota bacterium]